MFLSAPYKFLVQFVHNLDSKGIVWKVLVWNMTVFLGCPSYGDLAIPMPGVPIDSYPVTLNKYVLSYAISIVT